MKKFDFDANKEILSDSNIKSISTVKAMEENFPLEKTGPLTKENQFEYANRILKNLWEWAKGQVKSFQKKYNTLKEAVKNLYQENLKLKRENQEQHKKDLAYAKKDKDMALEKLQKEHNSEIKELKNIVQMFWETDRKTLADIYKEMKEKNVETITPCFIALSSLIAKNLCTDCGSPHIPNDVNKIKITTLNIWLSKKVLQLGVVVFGIKVRFASSNNACIPSPQFIFGLASNENINVTIPINMIHPWIKSVIVVAKYPPTNK